MRAWLVPADEHEQVQEIQVDTSNDHTLIRVSDEYFAGECVTLTQVDIRRLPNRIYKAMRAQRKRNMGLSADRYTHFSVDDAGLLKNLSINLRMTEAYGQRIVGLAVVYEEQLS